NAAAPHLYVVTRHSDGAKAAKGVDLPLHGVDVGDGRKIQVFAPDVRCKLIEKGRARGKVTGGGSSLDEGGAFPILAKALVIIEGGLGGERKRRGAGVRSQPQVGAEHVTLTRALGEHAHQFAGQSHKEGLHLEPSAQANAAKIVEHDEIDVGGVIEF